MLATHPHMVQSLGMVGLPPPARHAPIDFALGFAFLHVVAAVVFLFTVDQGQLDSSARLIWAFEKLGWASDVRWPRLDRLRARRVSP